jgi:hypothetical protein
MDSMLVHRVQSEFLEMPGLRLTTEQAARLWAVDRATSQTILDRLVTVGFLCRNRRARTCASRSDDETTTTRCGSRPMASVCIGPQQGRRRGAHPRVEVVRCQARV